MFVLKFWKTQGWKLFHPGEDVKVMESLQTAKNHCSFQFLLSVLSFPLGMPLLPFQPRPGQQQLQEKKARRKGGGESQAAPSGGRSETWTQPRARPAAQIWPGPEGWGVLR